jgi:PAS domain S-box-containing protein
MTTDFTTAIWEQNPDAIIVADSEGTILRWNPAAERIFGYTAAQAQGRTLGELVVPDALLSEDRDKRACAARDGIALYEGVRPTQGRRAGPRQRIRVRACGCRWHTTHISLHQEGCHPPQGPA